MLELIAAQPSDVPTRETLKFFESHIPVGATILEVGCGEGQVACELLKRGYFFRRNRLHSFIAPHQPATRSDRSRTRATESERIATN